MGEKEVFESLLGMARQRGAVDPAVVESTEGEPVIVDYESGRSWKVKIEEF